MIYDTIIRKAGKAMKGYEMLEDNDKVLIGLSGGKDSLALVEVLAYRQKIYKPKIEVIACHQEHRVSIRHRILKEFLSRPRY